MHLSIAKLSRFDEFDESDESDESDDGRCGKKLKLYNEVDYDSDDGKKFRLPHILYDPEELLRLMTRKPAVKETQGCLICGGDHLELRCPCLDKIPPGVEIDGDYDEVCLCCGRIGETCCSKGAYAVYKRCRACGNNGHWYWENMCPDNAVKQIIVPSIEELKEEVMKNKNKNKEEDQVMVDLGKDNKNKDDCGKEHEAKFAGGNEPSDQSRFKGCKAISELEPGPVQVRENLFSLPKHLPSIKELRLLLIGLKPTIDEAENVNREFATTSPPQTIRPSNGSDNSLSIEELIESCDPIPTELALARPTQSDTAAILYSSVKYAKQARSCTIEQRSG
ncbi:hypothetical protein ACLB2K_071079 [Fragaria x ananassa]